jgi:pimeloyl-ACP methyl ester carboxylesterase
VTTPPDTAPATEALPEPVRELVDLPDGRVLEIAVSGPEDGLPVLWHHGTPGCARQGSHLRKATGERGLRLVTYSRAGAGRSTRHPGRTVADVATDMRVVLDHLDAERCITGGGSGGGPHTLATGALVPERVVAVMCVCGVRPYGDGDGFLEGMGQDNLDEFALALEGEDALRPYLEKQQQALAHADADEVIAAMRSLLPPPDLALLTGEVGEDIAAGMRESVQTLEGWIDDDLAFTRGWGFDPGAISVPVSIWQGTEDLMVPAHHAEALSRLMPRATLHLEEGEGHLSIARAAMGRALDEALSFV